MARITTDANTLRAWDDLGRRLRKADPNEYARLIALARAFVRVHEDDELPELEYRALRAAIHGGKASA